MGSEGEISLLQSYYGLLVLRMLYLLSNSTVVNGWQKEKDTEVEKCSIEFVTGILLEFVVANEELWEGKKGG